MATPKSMSLTLQTSKMTPSSIESGRNTRKRIHQTMDAVNSDEGGKFVRINAAAANINSDIHAATEVNTATTPRRSTRKFMKPQTPSADMPPPKSVGTASRRRKTAAVALSTKDTVNTMESYIANESSGTNGDDNQSSKKKRRTANALMLVKKTELDVSSDTDTISESVMESNSRSRKSRANKANRIDAVSTSVIEMASETVQNGIKRTSQVHSEATLLEKSDISLKSDTIHEEMPSKSVNRKVNDQLSGSTTETDYNTADQSPDESMNNVQDAGKIFKAEKSKISGINLLNDQTEDNIENVQSLNKPSVPLIDLTDSLNGTAEPEHVLNVTYSPINDAATIKPLPVSINKLKLLRNSSTPKPLNQIQSLHSGKKPMKRLSKNTPHFDVPKEQPRSVKSRGTPYVRRVPHVNMPNMANTKVFGSARKEKIADGVKELLQQKRVTFNSPNPITKTKTPIAKSRPSLDHLQVPVSSSSQKGFGFPTPKEPATNRSPESAIKLPDFASIHQKLFEKMESIDVTVQRRQQRQHKLSERKENKGNYFFFDILNNKNS